MSLYRIHLQCRRPQVDTWVGKILWKWERLPTSVFLGFPCGSGGKESTCNVGNLGLIPGLGRSPGEGKSYPLQCSGLENSMDYTVYGVAKSQTQLSNFHFQSRYVYNPGGSKKQLLSFSNSHIFSKLYIICIWEKYV